MRALLKNDGLSLLEVVLSLLLFGLVASGVLLCFIHGKKIAEIDSHRISAGNIARAKVEFIKSIGKFQNVVYGSSGYSAEYPYLVNTYSDITDGDQPMIDSGPTGDSGDDLIGNTYVQVEQVNVIVGTNSFKAKNVTVTVAWTESRAEIREKVVTLLTENTVSSGG